MQPIILVECAKNTQNEVYLHFCINICMPRGCLKSEVYQLGRLAVICEPFAANQTKEKSINKKLLTFLYMGLVLHN